MNFAGIRPRKKRAETDILDPIALIAIDLDGTLLRSDKALTQANADAVKAAVRQGIHVVIATARPPRGTRMVYEKLGLKTWQINYNGALIYDPQTGQNVAHTPLPAELAEKVVLFARQRDPTLCVSLEILDKWYTDHYDPNLEIETGKIFNPDYIGPLDTYLKYPVTKLMILGPPEKLGAVQTAIARKFGNKIGITVSDPHLLQVVHPAVDKGRALEHIANHLGLPRTRVMAIGDAPNDLGMLYWAGLGVAVQNAWDLVRNAADVVVPSNNDNGVAVALRRYVADL